MADDSRRPRSNRPTGPKSSGRPSRPGPGKSGSARPTSGSGRPASGSGSGRPSSGGGKSGSGRPGSGGGKYTGSRPTGGGDRRGPAGGGDRRPRPAAERTADQQRYDGPPIPDDVSAKDLDKHARAELSGLPDKLADKVARHLVMAGTLLHSDPETAHQHALAARARAMRVGLVREATGETAYALGNWNEALAEFRAARRMTGRLHYAPMMADAERALGRPEKALEYDTPTTRAGLDDAGNIELTIVIAGARRDLGHTDAALQLLQTEPLHTTNRADWVTRLRYAYADTLAAAGKTHEAIEWFHRTTTTDHHHTTDAQQRITQLENELAESD